MATPQELARQKLIASYGSEQAAQEAARRVKSGQFSASDTLKLANATGIQDAAARGMAMGQKPATPAPVPAVTPSNFAKMTGVPSSRTTADGEIINPTDAEVADFNKRFPTTRISPTTPAATPAPVTPVTPSPLIPVATPTVGAIERPGVASSIATPVKPAGMGNPDADRFLALSSASPSTLTDDDRAFLRGINAKAALMGGINKALGLDSNTFQGNRVEATAQGFTPYDEQGNARQATAAEAEALRRSPIGQNALSVFNETETARKETDAAKASLAAEEQRRQEARAKQVSEYEAVLRKSADKSIANIREEGQKRQNSLQNNFSAQGGGRSTDATRAIDEVSKSIQEQVSAEESKYQLQVQAYLLQQQGADSEALKPYRDAIAQADLKLGQLQANAFKRMQEANAAGAMSNEQALQNLLATMTTQAKTELAMTGFDEKESARLGYFVRRDAQGNAVPMTGKDGEPIQFKSQVAEAAKPVKIGEDAKGRDIMGVYNAQTGKYEPLTYGVGGVSAGVAGGVGGGVRSTVGTGEKLTKITEIDAARLVNIIDKGPKSDEDVDRAKTILEEAGGDFDKALLAYSGFKLDDSKKELGLQALEAMQAAGLNPRDFTNMETVAKNINSGRLDKAYEIIEKAAFNTETGKAIKISGQDADYRSAMKSYERLRDMMEKNKDKFGVLSGRIANVQKSIVGDYDLQKMLSEMTATFANLRKNYAGSAVTESELKALEDYVSGSNKEPLKNVIAKIETVMQRVDDEYNSSRETLGLPRIEKIEQVKNRSGAYVKPATAPAAPAPSATPAKPANDADPLGIL